MHYYNGFASGKNWSPVGYLLEQKVWKKLTSLHERQVISYDEGKFEKVSD